MSKFSGFIRKSWNNLTHPEKWGSSYFYPVELANSLTWGTNTKAQNLKDFLEVPELNTVINYRAWAQSLVKLDVVSKTTEKPVTNAEQIVKVLRIPNWFQSQKELWRQTEIFRSVFGEEFIYFLRPLGMAKNYKAMFTLPSQYMEVIYPKNPEPFFLTIERPETLRYEYTWDGKRIPIAYEDVLHLNDNNADQKSTNYLNGYSKLNPLKPNIQNIRAAYEARNIIIANRGAVGILSNNAKDGTGSSMPMNKTEKETVQRELAKYGVMKNQYKYIMTNLALKWTQITTDLDKLRVFEEIEEDFKTICSTFGVPFELFLQSPSYENKEKAEEQFYQDTIIPTTQERIKALNDYLGTESKSWEIVGSFDHLPIFQEDLKERSEALNTLVNALNVMLTDGAITIQQYQEELQKFNIGKS